MVEPVSLINTLHWIDRMKADGLFDAYAICGAVAAYYYIEPAVTQDIDITIHFEQVGPIVTLEPIIQYLKEYGVTCEWRGEAIVIGTWAVQFIPNDNPIDKEALSNPNIIDLGGLTTYIWQIEYLMVKCLEIGRPKDFARLDEFLKVDYNTQTFCESVKKFGLSGKLDRFCVMFNHENVCR